MIEAEETPHKKNTGNLKNDSVFGFNYEEQSKNDQYIEGGKGGWEI